MATTTNLTTSYVGEAAQEYIHKCFLASATINYPAVTVKENVHKSWKIRRISSTDLLQDETCDFTAAGTVNLDERSLDTFPIEANVQMCKTDFLGDWGSVRMGRGANNKSLPPETAEGMINEILLTIGENIEHLIWEADSSGTDPFDGYIVKMLADASVVDVTGATITSSNVLTKMGECYEAWAGLDCYGHPDQIMYVGKKVGAAFQSALGAVNSDQGYLTQSVIGEKPWNYLGIPIFVAPGMRDSTIVVAKKSNLYVGTDSLSDQNEVTLKDMSEVDLSNNVRFRGGFHLGVEYGWSDEIVLCEPTNP